MSDFDDWYESEGAWLRRNKGALEAAFNAGHPKWISVEDRLPEEYGNYLCHFSDGDIETFQYDEGYDGCVWGVGNVSVIHWMPLPDPPGAD